MVDDPSAPPPGEDDDLAALDFSSPDVETESDYSGLDAVGEYLPADEPEEIGHLDAIVPADEGDDEPPVPVFTVSNPPGTVTVSAYLDGRVHEIDLAPTVTRMTEAELAEEIVVIAGLATQSARSAQFSFMLEGMCSQGHDAATTRDFLNRDLDLPSPEQAEAARADVFASRYADDHG